MVLWAAMSEGDEDAQLRTSSTACGRIPGGAPSQILMGWSSPARFPG